MSLFSHQMPKQRAFKEALARRTESLCHKDIAQSSTLRKATSTPLPIWTDARYFNR